MYVHRNTVCYRIERVKKKTGIDPLDFYGLCKLLMLVGQMERMADNAETRERQ
jgi:DNA-binding PucR family transcriptional regulator